MKEISIKTGNKIARPQMSPRAEAIEGNLLVVTAKPTFIPRNYRQYEVIWDDTGDSGNVYLCKYVGTLKAWYYITITAIP